MRVTLGFDFLRRSYQRSKQRLSSGGQYSHVASVGHEDRHAGHGQDVTGGSAQDHLTQPA
jgi:hypothetical protein